MSLARESPAVYVIEDVHWIDEVSASMLAQFLMVIPQTPSLVLVTYRPEYRGPLTQLAGAQTVALVPLSDRETAAQVPSCSGRTPPFAGWARRSPSAPPVIRFSPKRSCANSPRVVCCRGSRAHMCHRQRLLR